MYTMIERFTRPYYRTTKGLDVLQPLALLLARLYVAKVFLSAGLTKLRDWDTTLFLFEEEYSVPLLPYELAAWLATAGEILLPVLLILGLAGRFGALGLSIVNIVAILSLEQIAPAAFTLHLLWGLLLVQIVLWGSGLFSVDAWLKSRLKKQLNQEENSGATT